MQKLILGAVALAGMALTWTTSALAQTADDVFAQFDAYNAAIAAGDAAGADAAGAAAWQLAEQVWGDQRADTAALAFNLARLRADLGNWSEVAEPAERAVELAEAGSHGGSFALDDARYLAARAALALDPANQRAQRQFRRVLDDRRSSGVQSPDDVAGWTELGKVALSNSAWTDAIDALDAADELAAGLAPQSRPDIAVLLGVAHFQQWRIPRHMAQDNITPRLAERARKSSLGSLVDALTAFERSIALQPKTPVGESVTDSTATALAWHAATTAMLRTLDATEYEKYVAQSTHTWPIEYDGRDCNFDWVTAPDQRGLSAAGRKYVGAVVLQFDIAEDGSLTNRELRAEVPSIFFGNQIEMESENWRVSEPDSLPEECRRNVIYTSYTYQN